MIIQRQPRRAIVFSAIAALVALVALVGCGSGFGTTSSDSGTGVGSGTSGSGLIIGGVGSGGTGVVRVAAQPAVTSGSAGYSGAIVFLDENGNGLLDSGEPFAYSDAAGGYTLAVDPALAAGYPLLLETVAGATVDLATGRTVDAARVTTLRQAATAAQP